MFFKVFGIHSVVCGVCFILGFVFGFVWCLGYDFLQELLVWTEAGSFREQDSFSSKTSFLVEVVLLGEKDIKEKYFPLNVRLYLATLFLVNHCGKSDHFFPNMLVYAE